MTLPRKIPRDRTWEGTLALLVFDGYEFIHKRCQRNQSDIFQTRLMLRPVICMSGQEAVRLFYDTERFQRENALPNRIKASLLGRGGVQELDGEAHRHRKNLFMSLMTPESRQRLLELTAEQWQIYIRFWQGLDQVTLYEQVQELLCRAVCEWAGVPLQEDEVHLRARDFASMVEAFGAVGPRHLRGRRARKRAEAWIMKLIHQIREGKLSPPAGSAAQLIASHRDLKGNLLDKHTAAVELINILRPTVAIDRFITFAALALHQHPQYQARLQAGEEGLAEMFVQEVRRYFPYAPFLAALVRRDFSWQGYFFPRGRLVLLDVYGTNHDGRIWEQPYAFRPERFSTWNQSPFNFIPQGGGDYASGHRCAGEWVTIEQMKLAVNMLARQMEYQVPRQDLRISLTRIPAMPKSRFIIDQVRAIA